MNFIGFADVIEEETCVIVREMQTERSFLQGNKNKPKQLALTVILLVI
jgi:hypothetical protein